MRCFSLAENRICCPLLCENSHHSRRNTWKALIKEKTGKWSVKMFYICMKFHLRLLGKSGFLQCELIFSSCFMATHREERVFSCQTRCKHHSVTQKLLLQSILEFLRPLVLFRKPVSWWCQDRAVLGSVLQPWGCLQNCDGLQHTDLDSHTTQPLWSKKFKPVFDYLLQQVCAQSVPVALGMHETFIVVGSFGFKMAANGTIERF